MKKFLLVSVAFMVSTLFIACNKDLPLQWSEKSLVKMNYNKAVSYCENLDESGHNDWRLPNIDELRTLILNHSGTKTGGSCKISEKEARLEIRYSSDDCYGKRGSDFSKLGDYEALYSSSQCVGCSYDSVWRAGFHDGSISFYDKTLPLSVRCVRDK